MVKISVDSSRDKSQSKLAELLAGLNSSVHTAADEAAVQLRELRSSMKTESPEFLSLEKAYIKHLKWRFEDPKKKFDQQMLTSWLITFLIFVLAVSGMSLASLQFSHALKVGDLSSLETEFAFQTAGKVSTTSSLAGGTILVVSLLFLFLYVKYVYKIEHALPPHVSIIETDVGKLKEETE